MNRSRKKISLTSGGYDAEEIHRNVRALLSSRAEFEDATVPELCAYVAELASSAGYGARAAVLFLLDAAVENGRLSRNVHKHGSLARRLSVISRMAGAKDACKKPDFQRLLYELCGSILLTRPKQPPKRKRSLTCDDVHALVLSCDLDGRSGWESACRTETALLPELRLFGFFVITRNIDRSLQLLAYILHGSKAGAQKCDVVDFTPVCKSLDVDAEWLVLQQQKKKGHVSWIAWFVFIFSNQTTWSKVERKFVAASLSLHCHVSSSTASTILSHTMQTLHDRKISECRADAPFSAKPGEWQLPFRSGAPAQDLGYLYTDLEPCI